MGFKRLDWRYWFTILLIGNVSLVVLGGCVSQVSDEDIVASLHARENQAKTHWLGEMPRHVGAHETSVSGTTSLSFQGGLLSPGLGQAWMRASTKPLVFLPTLSDDDPEVVLTGLYLLSQWNPSRFQGQEEVERQILMAVRQKCCTHKDARIRWEAFHLIIMTWERGEYEDTAAVMSDPTQAVHDLAPFAVIRTRAQLAMEAKQTAQNKSSVSDFVEHKRRFVKLLITHLAHEDWQVRQAAVGELMSVLQLGIPDKGKWDKICVNKPKLPDSVNIVLTDWETRQATQKAWEAWWKEHEQEVLSASEPVVVVTK